MSETSRRNILAGAGATVAGGAVIGMGGRASAATPAATSRATSTEPVVAWVSNPASGQVHVMSGEDEVVVEDHDLVARILGAAGGR